MPKQIFELPVAVTAAISTRRPQFLDLYIEQLKDKEKQELAKLLKALLENKIALERETLVLSEQVTNLRGHLIGFLSTCDKLLAKTYRLISLARGEDLNEETEDEDY